MYLQLLVLNVQKGRLRIFSIPSIYVEEEALHGSGWLEEEEEVTLVGRVADAVELQIAGCQGRKKKLSHIGN